MRKITVFNVLKYRIGVIYHKNVIVILATMIIKVSLDSVINVLNIAYNGK